MSGNKYGMAGHAYLTATKIDATSFDSWRGLVRTEVALYGASDSWPFLNSSELTDSTPDRVRSKAWDIAARLESDLLLQLKIACRAIQVGCVSGELKGLLIERFKEDLNISNDEFENIWFLLHSEWSEHDEKEMDAICFTKFSLLLYDNVTKAIEECIYPVRLLFALENYGSTSFADSEIRKAIDSRINDIAATTYLSDSKDDTLWYISKTEILKANPRIIKLLDEIEDN